MHDGSLRDADRARERCLRYVVGIQRVQIAFRRGRDCLLGLRDLDVADHAGGEAVPRLLELLVCERHRGLGRFELLRGRAAHPAATTGPRGRSGPSRSRAPSGDAAGARPPRRAWPGRVRLRRGAHGRLPRRCRSDGNPRWTGRWCRSWRRGAASGGARRRRRAASPRPRPDDRARRDSRRAFRTHARARPPG